MFDYYSIYDSKIRLIFLYSDHDGKEKSRQENRVVKLINDYGKTLENKDKGKNLLHKLLLENRIKIYENKKQKLLKNGSITDIERESFDKMNEELKINILKKTHKSIMIS